MEFYFNYVSPSNRFSDKYSRAKKLLYRWNRTERIMHNVLERGLYKRTHNAQCAWAILVMMETGIRVGNENSAEGYMCINAYSDNFKKQIKTYGITTILKEHCQIKGLTSKRRYRVLELDFIGKKNVKQNLIVANEKMIDAFIWLTHPKKANEKILDVTHYDLTKFVKRHLGASFTIKDIRTAKVNKLFIENIDKADEPIFRRKSEVNKFIGEKVELTAEKIGHTKSVCKSAYISPHLFNYYKDYLLELLERNKEQK